jgi:hypothetical protein
VPVGKQPIREGAAKAVCGPCAVRASCLSYALEAMPAFVREQQDSLLAAWHGENAGTEELRAAVQHYHAFGNRLADFTHET